MTLGSLYKTTSVRSTKKDPDSLRKCGIRGKWVCPSPGSPGGSTPPAMLWPSWTPTLKPHRVGECKSRNGVVPVVIGHGAADELMSVLWLDCLAGLNPCWPESKWTGPLWCPPSLIRSILMICMWKNTSPFPTALTGNCGARTNPSAPTGWRRRMNRSLESVSVYQTRWIWP